MNDIGENMQVSKKEELNVNIIQNKNRVGLFVGETKMHK